MVTVRTGTGEPDAVTALWKDKLLYRLDLEPLSATATREVVEQILEVRRRAQRAADSGGSPAVNALFIQQLVKDQVAAGRIRQAAGCGCGTTVTWRSRRA